MHSTAKVIPFAFESHEVRTLLIDDQPWFVASDVALALKYREAKDMTRNLDDDEKGRQIVPTPGGDQTLNVINESGLYSAILRSRKPEAKRFKKWVTAEVLPAIRKHGHYEDRNDQLNTLLGQTIGTDGFRCLGAVLEGKLVNIPKPDRKRIKHHIWSQVHKAFSVVSAQDIPASSMDAARNFIAGYAIEGEWLGKDEKPDMGAAERVDICSRVARHRWRELDALTERQSALIQQQELLLEEQRTISKQIRDVRTNLYDPLFESTQSLGRLTGGAKADDAMVKGYIDRQNQYRAH